MDYAREEAFQFLNGAIKSKWPTQKNYAIPEFQFLNGAIKSREIY